MSEGKMEMSAEQRIVTLDEIVMAFVQIGRDVSVPVDVRNFATVWRDKAQVLASRAAAGTTTETAIETIQRLAVDSHTDRNLAQKLIEVAAAFPRLATVAPAEANADRCPNPKCRSWHKDVPIYVVGEGLCKHDWHSSPPSQPPAEQGKRPILLPATTLPDVLARLSKLAERLTEDDAMELDYAIEQIKALSASPRPAERITDRANRLKFREWFYSAPHRQKYMSDHPAYTAAEETWAALSTSPSAKREPEPMTYWRDGYYKVLNGCVTELGSPSVAGGQDGSDYKQVILNRCNTLERELAALQSKYYQVSAAHDIVCGRHVELETEIVRVRKELEAAQKLQAEQESIVIGAGPILCRNDKQHSEKWRKGDCVYCVAEKLEALAEKRGAALRKYGEHLATCVSLDLPGEPCDCGLALASAPATKPKICDLCRETYNKMYPQGGGPESCIHAAPASDSPETGEGKNG